MVKQQITDKKIFLILFTSLVLIAGLILISYIYKSNLFINTSIAILKNSKDVPRDNQNLGLNIFSKDEKPLKIDEDITLISTGDIGLVRDINYKILQKNNPNYPFLNIADYLKYADLTVINLEGPLIRDCPVILDGFTFCGDAENVKGLVFAGIDAANLANNHTTNYGLDGLEQTENILESNKIAAFGLEKNKIRYIKIKEKNIALVGFVELGNNWGGLNNATFENVTRLNKEAKENADIVVDAFHWGVEYTYKPSENQVLIGHAAIDSGADIVLGNHPHWIQPIEMYKNKYIIYAQGNTIFDQDWSQETREGVLYKFIYKNGVFEKVDEKYTIVENNSQPRFATDEESKLIKKKVSGN